MPFEFRTDNGPLIAMPLSNELEDRFILMNNFHSEQSWLEQVCDAADFLLAEANSSGSARILALNIHPWLMGQPHRIGALEKALAYLSTLDGVWSAHARDIYQSWKNQQD